MLAITERRADECAPSSDGDRDAKYPTVDAFGELMRRATKEPLSFGSMGFSGSLEAINSGMRLSLQSNLAQLPYSAEDAKSRGDLLAVVDTLDGNTDGLLKVVQGQKIILENEIPMPRTSAATLVRWLPI